MSSDLILTKSIDLAKHELKNARTHQLATDPTGLASGDKGLIWFNTTENVTKYWTGSAVVILGAPADLTNYYTKTQTDTQIASGISTHADAADPHTGYQKESEKDQNSGYAGLNSSGLVPLARQGSGSPAAGKYVDGGTGVWTILPSGDGGHVIKDEGVARTQRANLDFVGTGVTVTDDAANSATKVTIPGASGGGGSANMSYATMYKFAAV